MIRTIWTALSFLAVVNLLAFVSFGGWLWSTERMSVERLREIRDLLAMTTAESEAAAAEADADRAALVEAADERERGESPPGASDRRIRQARLIREEEAESRRRLSDFAAQRQAELDAAFAQLAQDRAALEAERQAWEDATQADRDRRRDEQFTKTVKLYEASPPKNAKQWLQNLVDAGQTDQAVAYLDAMNARSAKKILSLFKTEDEASLATELLERLRTLDLGEVEQETPGNDNAAAPDATDGPGTGAAGPATNEL